MRSGFTTGSCATAAAKAACHMLLFGGEVDQISIITPKGDTYTPDILDIQRGEAFVSCGVKKDGGDDPDVTTGLVVYAKVEYGESLGSLDIIIQGGEGVGKVTKPGLDQPVGSAAINSTPRKTIIEVIREECLLADFSGQIVVTIYVPGGEEVAQKTFNPGLGIVGGISIIGTSGVVVPMSTEAIKETIKIDLRQKRALGEDFAIITPGNLGESFLSEHYGILPDKITKCSNYIGETIDYCVELGFKRLILCGDLGKLVKLAGGIMNTHSREGDCRMEILSAACIRQGADNETLRAVLDSLTTGEALSFIEKSELMEPVIEDILQKIIFYTKGRAKDSMEIECILYSNERGLLAQSEGVEKWLNL